MKRFLILTTLVASPLALAGGDHDHDHHDHGKPAGGHHHEAAVTAGPNGGHVVHSKAGQFAFEVVVGDERIARITLLDGHGKAKPPGAARIKGIAGERSAPVKLEFAAGEGKDAGVLIADKPLPAGDHIPMILVIRTGDGAKPVTERFELHTH